MKMCMFFSSLATDTCCIITAGCQSPPSRSRVLQSNEIYFVCQAFQEADTFSLRHHQNMTFIAEMPKTSPVRLPSNINVASDVVCQKRHRFDHVLCSFSVCGSPHQCIFLNSGSYYFLSTGFLIDFNNA